MAAGLLVTLSGEGHLCYLDCDDMYDGVACEKLFNQVQSPAKLRMWNVDA